MNAPDAVNSVQEEEEEEEELTPEQRAAVVTQNIGMSAHGNHWQRRS